jgi:hypothetical protein
MGVDASLTVAGGSSVCNNTADRAGGSFLVGDAAQLTITGGSSVCYNIGTGGGGLCVKDKGHITITGASRVFNNRAVDNSGGGVSVQVSTQVEVSGGSSVCSNYAVAGAGGLYLTGNSSTRISNATICNNTCDGVRNLGGAEFNIDESASVYIVSALWLVTGATTALVVQLSWV